MRKLKILSLFDGGSATQCALKNLGFDSDDYTYYASEIDQYCIKVTQKNFPKTKRCSVSRPGRSDGKPGRFSEGGPRRRGRMARALSEMGGSREPCPPRYE